MKKLFVLTLIAITLLSCDPLVQMEIHSFTSKSAALL